MQDLQPYSCILEDCPSPDDLYGSRKDWETHMQKIHSADKWICYVCTQTPQIFETAVEYETHLLESAIHADTFTEDQLPFLVEDGRTPTMPDFKTCPLCNWSERHAEFDELPGQQSPIHNLKTTNIQDHVAEHLHSFALQALPDLKEGDADSLHTSVGSVENNLKLLLASDNTTSSSHYDDEKQRMHLLWVQLFSAYTRFDSHFMIDMRPSDPTYIWFTEWRRSWFAGKAPPFWTSVLASHVNDSIWLLDEYEKRSVDVSTVWQSLEKIASAIRARTAVARRLFRAYLIVFRLCISWGRNLQASRAARREKRSRQGQYLESAETSSQSDGEVNPETRKRSRQSSGSGSASPQFEGFHAGLRRSRVSQESDSSTPQIRPPNASLFNRHSNASHNVPQLSMADAIDWRMAKKRGTRRELMPLRDDWILDRLKNRSHVSSGSFLQSRSLSY